MQPDLKPGQPPQKVKTAIRRTKRPIKKYSSGEKANLYDYLSRQTRNALDEKRRYIAFLQEQILKDNQTCVSNIANSRKAIQEGIQGIEAARSRAAKENQEFGDDTIISVYTGGFTNLRQAKESIKELENHIAVNEKNLAGGGCGHGYVGGFIDVKGMEEAIKRTNEEIRRMAGGKELKELSPEQKVKVEQKFLKYYEAQGVDVKKLTAFRDSLLRRINTLKPGDELGGFLDSLGFTNKEELGSMEITQWQEKVSDYVLSGWLKSLTSGNVDDFKKQVKKLGTNVGKFDESLKLQTEGAFEQIKGDQKFVEDILKNIPYVDKAMDFLEIVSGESLSGDKKGPMERIVNGVIAYGPGALDILAKKNPAAKKMMENIGDQVNGMKDSMKAMIAEKMKISTKDLDTFLSYLKKGDTSESEELLKDAYNKAKKGFARTENGGFLVGKLSKSLSDKQVYLKTLKQIHIKGAPYKIAKDLFSKTKTAKNLDINEHIKNWAVSFDKETKKIQKDKMTRAILKKAEDKETRQFAKLTELSIQKRYRDIDKRVAARLLKEPGVANKAMETLKETAHKEKIPNKELTCSIEPVKISNREKNDEEITFKRKDQVVYQVKVRKKTAENKLSGKVINESDVEHVDAQRIYAEEYWKALNDTQPAVAGMDEAKLLEYTKKHDSSGMCYDRYENYNTWDMKVEDYVTRTNKPAEFEIHNFIHSVNDSSGKWFSQAQAAQEKEKKTQYLEQGMRQAVNYYDNRFLPKLKSHSPYNYQHLIPAKIRFGIDLFRQVGNMLIPPEEAEFILAKQYNLPEDSSGSASAGLLYDLTGFIGNFEKEQLKNNRESQADLLKQRLSHISSKENNMSLSNTLSDGIHKINHTLQRQLIIGDQFISIRENFLKERRKFAKEHNKAKELNQWAAGAFHAGEINRAELKFLQEKQ